jgi:hypothetical protein
MPRLTLPSAVAAALVAAMPAFAHGVPDQVGDFPSGALAGCVSASLFQSFTPALTPLVAVGLGIVPSGFYPPAGKTVTVRIRQGSPTGPILAQASRFLHDDEFDPLVHFDLPAALAVTPGATYVIEVLHPGGPQLLLQAWVSQGSVYAGGTFYDCSSPPVPRNEDARFTTYAAAGAGCSANDATLCLRTGRFRVTAHWRTAQGTQGSGHAVALTDDSGYFWFFTAANVEVVVKVRDACGLNQRFWVFSAGLTNVEVTLTVVDTETDTMVVYENPLNRYYPPILDTDAFATCP